MRVLRVNRSLRGQAKGADKGFFQLRQEVERSAEKRDAAPDGLSTGQAGDGLIHHRLEDRGSQIRRGGSLVNEGLDVRFGEHAAARGDGIELPIIRRGGIEPGGVGLQKRGHLVDKGAGAAGTYAVHPLLKTAAEINNLRVLAAKFYGDVRLGAGPLQRPGHSHHFLYKGNIQRLRQIDAPRAGDPQIQRALSQLCRRVPQQPRQRLLRMRLMAAIVSENNLSLPVQYHQLNRGGAYVDARAVCFHRSLSSSSLFRLAFFVETQ